MTFAARRVADRPADLIGVFGGLFAGYAGLSAAIPVMPIYVKEVFTASDTLTGLAVTATAITALLTRPIAGHIADIHGCRMVMLAGSVLVAAGGALYFLPLPLSALIVVRLLLGVGEAAAFTAGAVWTMSLATRERRGQLIGLYGVSMWGGISVGTFIGSQLLSYGYGAVWSFCMLAPLAGCVMIVRASAPPSADAPGAPRRLTFRSAAWPGLGLALASAGYAVMAAFLVLDLRRRGIGSGVLVLSAFSAVYAATRLVIGHVPDRYGARTVAALAACGEALGLVIVALAPNLAIALVGSVVMGMGFSLLHPSLALLVMDHTNKRQQGAALGAYTSFWDLGLAGFGPALGAVAGVEGYSAAFAAAAGCALLAAAVALSAPYLMPPLDPMRE